MKRTIAILLFFISCMLYAETGYRGFEWGTSEFIFELKAGTEEEPLETGDMPITAKVYKTKLLGEERNLYYYFANEILVSALYFISSELTDRLLNNLEKNKLLAQRSSEEATKLLQEELKQIFTNEEEQNQNLGIFMLGSFLITLCFQIDDADFNQLEKQEGECLIYIYNYNNDTRLYIYKNITKGKTAVVYIPHEQDY